MNLCESVKPLSKGVDTHRTELWQSAWHPIELSGVLLAGDRAFDQCFAL